jgi:Cu(I)/Ag(I) efflux system membrane fusion protein
VVIYYRDPDGKPLYSAEPKTAPDGRDYVAVRASEDVSFKDEPQGSPAAGDFGTPAGERVLYYRNPMGLPDTSPVPKKDSMGMDYIPVYEGQADDGVTVTLSPGKLQRTGVRFEKVERRVLSDTVRAPGTIEEDERRISVISVRSDAFIEKVENVTTGDHVYKGEPLFQLYSPEISVAAAQYLSAIGSEGGRRRLENLGVPNEVITEIERTRRAPISITWRAPRDGVVVERNITEGMRAKPGATLFRIVDHSVVWVLADVPERDVAKVREGQTATVRLRGMPGTTFTAAVTRIYPHLTAVTRTARVRIELANADGTLRPGMYADVDIATGSGTPVLAVSESALIDSGTRQIVILDRGEGRFEPREVQVGTNGNGFVEIRNGVAEGDQVVAAGNFLIDAESNLNAALRGMTGLENAQ